jgi:lysophospholipase L1-like esterase
VTQPIQPLPPNVTPGTGTTPAATTTTLGLIQLGGDLGGTAAAPTVPGLSARAVALTPTAVQTAAYTATSGQLVQANAATAAFTVTLPAATAGLRVGVTKVNADTSVNTVTVAPAGTDTISGTTVLGLPGEVRTYTATAGQWVMDGGAVPSGTYVLEHEARMRKYYVKIGQRATAPAQILAFGDSFFSGSAALTSTDRRWQQQLQSRLRAALQPAGVAGATYSYVQAYPSDGGLAGLPVTRTGTVGSLGWPGLGLSGAELSSDGTGNLTFTFTGTRCKLAYVAGPYGKLNIVLDGGAATIIDTYAPTAAAGQLWNSGALAAGSHTLVVTRDATSVAGRTCEVEGLHVYNGDEAAGVRVLDGGHYGLDTTGPVDSFNRNYWPQSVAAGGPYAMILLGLDHNDASIPRTAATHEANLKDIINLLRTVGGHTGTIGLVWWPKRLVATQATWDSYYTVLQDIVARDADTVILDLSVRIPAEPSPYSDPAGLGLWASTDHFVNAGDGYTADLLASLLTPR